MLREEIGKGPTYQGKKEKTIENYKVMKNKEKQKEECRL